MRARAAALSLLLALGCGSDDGGAAPPACQGEAGCAGAPQGGAAGSAGKPSSQDILWSKHFEGVADRYVSWAAPAPGGDVVLVGFFVGTIDLGGGPLSSGEKWSSLDPPWNAFVARLSSDGAHKWSKRFGGSGAVRPQGAAVDDKGNVALVGSFSGSVAFGETSLSGEGPASAFVARLSPEGQPLWAKSYGTSGEQSATAVAFAGSDLLVAGSLGGAADLGGGPLESKGEQDIFVVRLGSDGAHKWSKRFGGPGPQRAMAVAAADGDLVLAGSFTQKLDLGRGAMESEGGSDLFVARFDGDGDVLWNLHAGDKADQIARAVAFSGGKVTIAGDFGGVIDLGEAPEAPQGSCGKDKSLAATGLCYTLSADKKTFDEARAECKKQGGRLATVGSPGELNFLKKTFKFESAWVGASDAAAEGTWSWDSGVPFSFAPWNEGEPNGKEAENCAELTPKLLNDIPCTEARLFLCERAPSSGSGAGGASGAGGKAGSGGAAGKAGSGQGGSGQAGSGGEGKAGDGAGGAGQAGDGAGGASGGGQGGSGGALPKTALKSKGGLDGFVAQLDGAGRKRWDRALGDGDEQRLWAVIHDGDSVVIAGDAPGDFALGAGALAPGHVLVASLDDRGAPRWAMRLGPGVGQGLALAPGPQRIYAGGVFTGKLAAGSTELSSPDRVGAFLLALKP